MASVFPQPIMRIPVVGPDGFNTLVVVRHSFRLADIVFGVADNKLHRYTWPIATDFVLVGYDPRATIFQHSTSAAIQMLQRLDDSPQPFDSTPTVLSALDTVDRGYFDIHGTWTLDVSVALMTSDPDTVEAANIMISSWILCWEPPVDPRQPGANKSLLQSPGSWRGPNPLQPVHHRRPRAGPCRYDRLNSKPA